MLRLTLVLLTLATVVAAPVGAAQKTSCARAGDTVLRNATARVYDIGQKVYACHLKTRKRTFLTRYGPRSDDLEDYTGFIRGRLAGRFVAFGEDFGCSRYGYCSGLVRVVDTRTGADHASAGVTILGGMPNAGRTPSLPALHLRPDGLAAFVIGPANDVPWEVWRLSPGAEQRLDAGNVDPRSLATNETRIYWTRDGQAFSATWR